MQIMETGKIPRTGLGIMVIILLIYYIGEFMVIVENKGLESLLVEYGSMAQFLFFLLCLAQPIILPLPEALTIPAGSMAFGASSSFFLGFSGTLTGIIIMFFIARSGGVKVASKLVKEKHLKSYQEYVKKNETVILALLFIIPVLPDEIICVGAGIGAVSFKKFLAIASLSKFLTAFVLAYSVSLAKYLDLTSAQLILSCSVMIGIVFFITVAFNQYWNKKRMEM
ncbi:SNARE associated Golgi protein [Bacillus sp. CHD6a]|nr:SNARE associated Golgi protein [Bacillus sp. CHD6a]